jgi:hypothetical protein
MALTKTILCNLALSKIGNERVQLADFDTDTGKIKDQCDLHYEPTLHELVRMHSWGCTKERVQLVDSGNTPTFGWEYEFDLPADCLRPLFLVPTEEATSVFKPNIDWTVEGRTVLANQEDVWLLYIKEPAPADMDSLFASAFYTLLASKLAVPIAGDQQLYQTILNEFMSVVMPEARRVNAFEGKESPVIDSDWLEATFVSTGSLGSSWPPFGSATWESSYPWS